MQIDPLLSFASVLSLCALHIGIELVYVADIFPHVCISLCLIFTPPEIWDAIESIQLSEKTRNLLGHIVTPLGEMSIKKKS